MKKVSGPYKGPLTLGPPLRRHDGLALSCWQKTEGGCGLEASVWRHCGLWSFVGGQRREAGPSGSVRWGARDWFRLNESFVRGAPSFFPLK